MYDQMTIAVEPEDHQSFKEEAVRKKKSMKELFHDWVEKLIKKDGKE